MSSSLLLGNFMIQDQQQHAPPTQTEMPSSPIAYHQYYKEHDEELIIERTGGYSPPVTDFNMNTTTATTSSNQSKLKACNCCPYGYHIDLDFVRYCEELAANGKRPSSRQIDRRNKRRQRKSLEVMLGFEEQWVLDYEKDYGHPSKHKSQFQTVYEAFDDLEQQQQQKVSSPYDNVDIGRDLVSERTEVTSNQVEQGDFVNNILFDVYTDFERTLERVSSTRGRKNAPEQQRSCISATGGDESYNSEKHHELEVETVHQYPSPGKREASTFAQQVSADRHGRQQQQQPKQKHILTIEEEVHETVLHHIAAADHRKQSEANESYVDDDDEPLTTQTTTIEIDKLSLANRNLSDQLQSVRYQLNDNLTRVRDFEERVKLIPKLQLELSVEKAENRDLHLKLKALETELEQKVRAEAAAAATKHNSTTSTTTETLITEQHVVMKPHRVCATSLESLNLRFPSNSTSPIEQQPTPKISTQNVGCMTTKVVSRDVGVVTIPSQVPHTRSTAINTDITGAKNPFDTEKPKPSMHSVGVQQNEPKPQMRSVATVTDRAPSPPPPPRTFSVGVMAKPAMQNNSCHARPEIRSIGLDSIYEKPRTRTFGTDPIKHLAAPPPPPPNDKPDVDSPISLKLLDAMPSKVAEPVKKEFTSTGVQYSPEMSNKSSQCAAARPPTPPPQIHTKTESTDTSDLTLHIHRGVNTDAATPTRDRLTNTERIRTNEMSTNTTEATRSSVDSATNTEAAAMHSEKTLEDQSCHNCLAKIEIKQRTIIKNPNKREAAQVLTKSTTNLTEITNQHTSSQEVINRKSEETVTEHSMQHSEEVQSTAAAAAASSIESRIPRPTALISPRSEKKFIRQNTYTIPNPESPEQQSDATQCPAEAYLTSCNATTTSSTEASTVRTSQTEHHSTETHSTAAYHHSDEATAATTAAKNTGASAKQTTAYAKDDDDDEPKLWSHSMKSSSTYSQLASSTQKPRQKVNPSKEIQAALKVINDSLLKGQHLATTLKNANKIVQKEWFRISSTETAQPFEVEDYLDCFEEYSPNLLRYIVNLTDANGNTSMHYAVSHGNFDVVSILLDSKVCNINSTNNAGYTCVMLVSLAKLDVAEHQTVVQRLFQIADVNVRAKKHSQTALMLATSHGNYNMVRMLLDAGADINIQDEDGSTALMCAAEHGRMDIIKILLAQPDCDSTIQDLDGSTALKISLEAGYRDIGVLLYAHEYMIKNKSPYTSLRGGSGSGRSRKPSTSLTSSTNALVQQGAHVASNSSLAMPENDTTTTKHIS